MKLSCNGCRILRKGCSDNCIIRPCLEWINSPESQANATLFLAKFYGRTGLLNLITAAPQNLGPGAVFRSLLYEACGRLVNPTYGSLGLFWTGEWARCEAAVDAVLTGSNIDGVALPDWPTSATFGGGHALPACDIRHVPRGTILDDVRERTRFNRTGQVTRPKPQVGSVDSASLWKSGWESESVMMASLVSQDQPNRTGENGVNLELTLGFRCQSTRGEQRNY
ncbi:LOB domain-containing protein 40-like [Gastrolobium bilobum]|uniref:LOB domain-containing protein 40-like n=1 Tax=Gastrolobium bilobum TaxID=150636 RepID=UPI002AB2ADC6|nr:LOB domain-containing protein 40-like [Gastrolobium bilobum]